MKIDSAITCLLHGRDLSRADAETIFRQVFQQNVPESKIKTLLLLLAKKGETAGEVSGCLSALEFLEKPSRVSIPGLIDTCGTGGDGKQSLNISTLAALVIAGAGGKVAKHGNRAISSHCGSSDLMEALGVNLTASKSKMVESIRKFGVGYFHAPYHHPIFSRMQALRKKIKSRTIFNLLGPLANPLNVTAQIVGVSSPATLKLYAEVLRDRKRSALVCHSRDGFDEISSAVPTSAAKILNGKIIWGRIEPSRLAFDRSRKGMPEMTSIRESKNLALRLLQNKLQGPARDTVVLNAAAGLWISGKAKGLREGVKMADDSILSGAAYRALQGLVISASPRRHEEKSRFFKTQISRRKKRSSR